MVALAQKRETSRERERELSPWEANAIEVKQRMNALPNPHVAMNEYPNPPWNTTAYNWDETYQENSPQYRAQQLAKQALTIGLHYSTVDRYAGIREQIEHERAGVQSLGVSSRERKQVQSMETARSCEPLQTENNGIVTDTGLILIKQGKPARVPFSREICHVGDIMQLCLDHNLRAIWVLAGTRLSELATREFIEAARGSWEVRSISYTKVPAGYVHMCKFVSGWKKKDARAGAGDGRTCYVGFAEHNERWDFEEITSPLLLLATLAYLEDAFDMAMLYSPSNTGKRLMQRSNERERVKWIQPVKELATIPPVVNTSANDCVWKRPLTEQEAAQGFLVAYDKNSQYPASCTSVLLGVGLPAYVSRPQFDIKKLQPGVWHIKLSGNSTFNGLTLPHPVMGYGETIEPIIDTWAWSYTVKLCIELGYTVDIVEAWVWEEAHTTLRPWASETWASRSTLKTDTERYPNAQARQVAYERAKSIANHAIGLLATAPANPNWAGAYDLYRPDWRELIRDNARYWMFRRIMKYLDMGYSPVGCFVDCLYYVTSESNPETALAGFMDRAGKLGGYKVKYSRAQVFPVSLIASLFNDESLDMGSINAKLLELDRQAQ